ncbi:MAG: hypothetical protein WBC19_10290 [Pyrinomonadaceae bacterium]
MKFTALILTLFLVAVTAAGQVTTLKNDIPESQYLAAEAKAAGILKTANYRSVWTKEYFEDRAKAATLQERTLIELIPPDKRRIVDEKFYDKPSRVERIWVDKALFEKRNDEPWQKYSGGTGINQRIESGQVKNQFRYLPAIDLEGETTNFYELVSTRTANKFSQNGYAIVKYIRTTRTWYSLDGKLLKEIEETMIEGQEEMLRETTI